MTCQRAVDREVADCYDQIAGWSSQVARWAHNPKVASSNLAPATNFLSLVTSFQAPEEKDCCRTPRLSHAALALRFWHYLHQIAWILLERIRPSRLSTGTP